MLTDEIRVHADALQTFTQSVFTHAGLPPDDAAIEADVLVWANLRGVDSHGVLRIPWYLEMVEKGQMNPRPNIQTLKETPAILFLDADRAFGPVVTVYAMQQAIAKAKNVGIGWALIRNVTHQGAMGYYSLMAAQEDMAGIAIVCSPPNMAPFGAKAAGVHNSPIAIAVPAGSHHPLVLDMATSIAAGGKLTLAADKGIPLGEGWALDEAGNQTTDPNLASVLLPTGGPKGSGLALMFQCLTSLMANNPLLVPALQGAGKGHNQNSIIAAIDIGLFTDVDTFKSQVDDQIDGLKALPKADGFADILMPGEPEFNTLADRTQHGIPLPPGTVQKLRDAATRFGIALPDGLNSPDK
ncbi:Ldh family oxidoreductase [Chloroflexi bacterium TSY]|nr:Ldh family oxidoreductase [Chloroflexi bacterium TSY]MBV7329602.1 Ldh family oxidoreductase [Chloroflexi bacterium TSY]